jgi:hypothetical protein
MSAVHKRVLVTAREQLVGHTSLPLALYCTRALVALLSQPAMDVEGHYLDRRDSGCNDQVDSILAGSILAISILAGSVLALWQCWATGSIWILLQAFTYLMMEGAHVIEPGCVICTVCRGLSVQWPYLQEPCCCGCSSSPCIPASAHSWCSSYTCC